MLVIRAHSKINLALEVVRRRDDGRHDIESVLVPIDWHDLVAVRLSREWSPLRVTGGAAHDVPGGGENLAVRAAEQLNAAADNRVGAVRLHAVWLDKQVRARAGLGGGSADGAAVLRAGAALLRQQGVALDTRQLAAMAARLGSDVPALLARRPVHVSGHGDVLAAIDMPVLHLVIVFLAPAATGPAYQSVQRDEMSRGERVRNLVSTLAAGSSPPDTALGSALEPAALRINPELAAAASRLRRSAPGVHWHMTGSGGAYFAVVDDGGTARDLAEQLRRAGMLARASRTLAAGAAGG